MTKSSRYRRAQIVVVCAGIALLAFVYRVVGDDTVWGAWIAIVPPVFIAVILIPTTLRLRSWTVAAFVLAFLASASEWPRTGPTQPDLDETLRLASWNIGAGNTEWASAVQPLEPDFVLVQESSKPASAWDGFDWFGTLEPGWRNTESSRHS
jgi:hypothetical protein